MILQTRLCIKTGIQEQGTEYGERGEWWECYILMNVAKYPRECRQTFRRISPNIPENVAKHSREFCQTFREMSPDILRNVAKYCGKCPQTFRISRQTFRGML